jgi:hypothetical protein
MGYRRKGIEGRKRSRSNIGSIGGKAKTPSWRLVVSDRVGKGECLLHSADNINLCSQPTRPMSVSCFLLLICLFTALHTTSVSRDLKFRVLLLLNYVLNEIVQPIFLL